MRGGVDIMGVVGQRKHVTFGSLMLQDAHDLVSSTVSPDPAGGGWVIRHRKTMMSGLSIRL